MKKIFLALAVCLSFLMTGCGQYIQPGTVGILVNLHGSDKGVNAQVIKSGKVYVTWNEQLYTYQTFTQTHSWTADVTEGSLNDESITFQDKNGTGINTDVSISYSLDEDKITNLFQKYRLGIKEITDGPLRNAVRDAFVLEASTHDVEYIYGEGKAALLEAVLKRVRDQVTPNGIKIENLSLIGKMRLPTAVENAITAKIVSTQEALQVQNQLAKTQAQAAKDVAFARGRADAAAIEAEGIAKKAAVLRNAPELVEWEKIAADKEIALAKISKWNGVGPVTQVEGGQTLTSIK